MMEEESKVQEVSYPQTLSPQVVKEIDDLSAKLIDERKSTKPPTEYPSRDNLAFKDSPAKLDLPLDATQTLEISKQN